jgi:hypothetical protein
MKTKLHELPGMETLTLELAQQGLIPPLKQEEFKDHMESGRAEYLMNMMDYSVYRTHPFIPVELLVLDRWVCANIDMDDLDSDELSLYIEHPTDPTLDPEQHQCSFEEAANAVREGRCHHIAFARQPNDGFTFIEIADPDNITPLENALPDAYCEVDVLGQGIVCFYSNDECRFKVPAWCSPTEYSFNKKPFMVMTGRYLPVPGSTYVHPCPDICDLYFSDLI